MKRLVTFILLFATFCFNIFPASTVSGATNDSKKIALTFDDGPDIKITPLLLDFLKEQNIKATFFVVGENVKKHPELVKRMDEEGHIVLNHSYTHMNFKTHSMDAVRNELKKTGDEIQGIIGKTPVIFRPPYGSISKLQLQTLKDEGMTSVLWDIDTVDWKNNTSKAQIIKSIGTKPHSNDIVLMHTMPKTGKTLEALKELVPQLKSEGYIFVTVDKILGVPPYKK